MLLYFESDSSFTQTRFIGRNGVVFTRSLGEFGAVIFIAGNMPYISEITSLMIFVRLQEFDFPAASAIASVVLLTSLLLLLMINLWQGASLRRIHGR